MTVGDTVGGMNVATYRSVCKGAAAQPSRFRKRFRLGNDKLFRDLRSNFHHLKSSVEPKSGGTIRCDLEPFVLSQNRASHEGCANLNRRPNPKRISPPKQPSRKKRHAHHLRPGTIRERAPAHDRRVRRSGRRSDQRIGAQSRSLAPTCPLVLEKRPPV